MHDEPDTIQDASAPCASMRGARCGNSARRDLRGGRRATGVPTSIAALKPDQQMVLRLLDLEQKSVREICSLTGWRESKVKVTAMRARRQLAETLARLENRKP